MSQGTLAEMIGTTRSRVSFFMNRSRKMGVIDYNGNLRVHWFTMFTERRSPSFSTNKRQSLRSDRLEGWVESVALPRLLPCLGALYCLPQASVLTYIQRWTAARTAGDK